MGWPGENPDKGSLTPQQLGVLCEMLARRTATPDQCWLLVWDGFGNLPRAWQRRTPRVQQPARVYYIFERPLAALLEFSAQVENVGSRRHPQSPSLGSLVSVGPPIADEDASESDEPRTGPSVIQSPNQWWPEDRAWCVASEIDFDSTLVAGSADLIAEITADPQLEALAVEPTDDLTYEGDAINPQPPPAN
jgi:hypothetical protein